MHACISFRTAGVQIPLLVTSRHLANRVHNNEERRDPGWCRSLAMYVHFAVIWYMCLAICTNITNAHGGIRLPWASLVRHP